MPTPNKNDLIIIELSLDILHEARDRAKTGVATTTPVRLALRSLRPFMRAQWSLHSFWDGAGGENEIGRSASCTASFNGIVHQLRAAGIKVKDYV